MSTTGMEKLEKISTQYECVAENIDEYVTIITNAYSSVINKCMPLKKLSRKQKQRKEKPWITYG